MCQPKFSTKEQMLVAELKFATQQFKKKPALSIVLIKEGASMQMRLKLLFFSVGTERKRGQLCKRSDVGTYCSGFECICFITCFVYGRQMVVIYASIYYFIYGGLLAA